MPAPATVDDLVKLIRKSGMIDEPRLDAYIERLRLAGPLTADVRKLAHAENLSLEMAARRLRHDFLARTARRLKIPAIAQSRHIGTTRITDNGSDQLSYRAASTRNTMARAMRSE